MMMSRSKVPRETTMPAHISRAGDFFKQGETDMTAVTPGYICATPPLDRQRAAMTEDELRRQARELIRTLCDHWVWGADTAVELAVTLAEKHRRLLEGGGGAQRGGWRELAMWLAVALEEFEEEDEQSFEYLPTADDCRELVLRIAHLNDDYAFSRPGFLDIADIVAREEGGDLVAGLPHEGGARTITTRPGISAAHIDSALRCPCGKDLRPHDIDVSSQGVRIICRCHRLLLELELGGGSGSEGELVS
jgi:hypothetical protein